MDRTGPLHAVCSPQPSASGHRGLDCRTTGSVEGRGRYGKWGIRVKASFSGFSAVSATSAGLGFHPCHGAAAPQPHAFGKRISQMFPWLMQIPPVLSDKPGRGLPHRSPRGSRNEIADPGPQSQQPRRSSVGRQRIGSIVTIVPIGIADSTVPFPERCRFPGRERNSDSRGFDASTEREETGSACWHAMAASTAGGPCGAVLTFQE